MKKSGKTGIAVFALIIAALFISGYFVKNSFNGYIKIENISGNPEELNNLNLVKLSETDGKPSDNEFSFADDRNWNSSVLLKSPKPVGLNFDSISEKDNIIYRNEKTDELYKLESYNIFSNDTIKNNSFTIEFPFRNDKKTDSESIKSRTAVKIAVNAPEANGSYINEIKKSEDGIYAISSKYIPDEKKSLIYIFTVDVKNMSAKPVASLKYDISSGNRENGDIFVNLFEREKNGFIIIDDDVKKAVYHVDMKSGSVVKLNIENRDIFENVMNKEFFVDKEGMLNLISSSKGETLYKFRIKGDNLSIYKKTVLPLAYSNTSGKSEYITEKGRNGSTVKKYITAYTVNKYLVKDNRLVDIMTVDLSCGKNVYENKKALKEDTPDRFDDTKVRTDTYIKIFDLDNEKEVYFGKIDIKYLYLRGQGYYLCEN